MLLKITIYIMNRQLETYWLLQLASNPRIFRAKLETYSIQLGRGTTTSHNTLCLTVFRPISFRLVWIIHHAVLASIGRGMLFCTLDTCELI